MNKRIIKKWKKNFTSYKIAAILQSVMMWYSDEFNDDMEPVRLVKALYGSKRVDIPAVQDIINSHINSEYEAGDFAIANSNLYCDILRRGGRLKNSAIKRWAEHYHERFYYFYKKWEPCFNANYSIYFIEFINAMDRYYPIGTASTIDEAIKTAEKIGDDIAKEREDENCRAEYITHYKDIKNGIVTVEVVTWDGEYSNSIAEIAIRSRDIMFG